VRAAIKVVVLGMWLAAVGCGDSKSDGAGDREQFLSQLCAEFSDCCKAAGRPSDGSQCRAFYGAFTSASSYDQAAASTCLDEVRAQGSAKCDASSTTTPSCGKVFATSGTKQPGEACEDDSDCAPPASGRVECASDFGAGATVQQCQVRLPGKAGSTPCIGTVEGKITYYSGSTDGIPAMGYLCDRADGLSCDSQTGACESLSAVGEACAGSRDCVTSGYCAFAEGVCKARAAVGATCSGDDECVAGAYCDPAAKACAATRANGAACTADAECESDNCVNMKCAVEDDLSLTFLCGTN
jgi:hypothetical protein